jgi:hypothetical protein
MIPVIDFGHMALAQCVLDGERMKLEHVAQPVFNLGILLLIGPLDIDPHDPALIRNGVAHLTRRPVEVESTAAVAVDYTDLAIGRALVDLGSGWSTG